jgi:hypothetical protein
MVTATEGTFNLVVGDRRTCIFKTYIRINMSSANLAV